MSDLNLYEKLGDSAWRDVAVRIRGEEIAHLVFAFDRAFQEKSYAEQNLEIPVLERLKFPKKIVLNDTFYSRFKSFWHYARRMRRARQRLWIQTPYFVPIRLIYRAMLRAARKGVDVRLILPQHNDVKMVQLQSLAILDRLLKAGVKIYEYTPGFSHQKILFADDYVSIGSSNMNHRSALHDLEVDVAITHFQNKRALERQFLNDQIQSIEISREKLGKRPLWNQFLGRMFLWIRYWS